MRTGHSQIALLVLLAAGGVLFAFGLPGGFLLDDFGNLANLEQVRQGPVYGAIYVTEGPTGFPGRPLSYLSFFLQSASWPHDPLAFKAVNIALHLANGALVYLLGERILRLAGREASTLALIAAGVWLVHPIQVSTVLYVVQRMTELSALFCLCGILAYLKGRSLAAAGRIRAGYFWMSGAVAVATPLAILSKENGALLPLYIAVIEFTFLAGVARPPRWKLWAGVFLALPPLVLAAYVAAAPWIDVGRLNTQAVVLWDYVAKILLPRPRAFGIYFDDYPVAAAPWSSVGTALALLGWCAALGAALAWRRRLPVVSFGILWFLSGHLLESTVIPLELYFEHRNYLPLFGPAFALGCGATRLWGLARSLGLRRVYASLGAAASLVVTGVTWVEARTWSDPVQQVAVWALERPTSQRAQYGLGVQYLYAGRYAEASETWARAQSAMPQEAYFGLGRLLIGCVARGVPVPQADQVAAQLAKSPVRPVTVDLLDHLALQFEKGTCQGLAVADALAVTDGALANPLINGKYRWSALYIKGRLHAVQGELDPAVRALEAADEILPNLGVLELQVTWLASAGLYDEALQFVDKGRRDARWRPWQRALYVGFFDSWEREVRSAARRNGVALKQERL